MEKTTEMKCKACGGELVLVSQTLYRCDSCRKKVVMGNLNSEENTLLTMASEYLRKGEFDSAYDSFSSIIGRFPDSCEAYWGALLAKNGIMYVDDKLENKKVPTCHNILKESILQDKLYKRIIDIAPVELKDNYVELAAKIEAIRKEWLEKASKEPPYDIFICFKDSDRENKIKRTDDSYDAQEIYTELSKEGYRVFFSRVSLRDKSAEQYEPYIFNALNTAKVMIVFSSKAEYIQSTWMKNEWTRYLRKIANGDKLDNSLVLCYKNMNFDNVPPALKTQGIDANSMTFYNTLTAHIKKIITAASTPKSSIGTKTIKAGEVTTKVSRATVEQLATKQFGQGKVADIKPDEQDALNQGYSFLKNDFFEQATRKFDDVLAMNQHNSQAIWGQILSRHGANDNNKFVKTINELTNTDKVEFSRAIQCASKQEAIKYLGVLESITKRFLGDSNMEKATQFFTVLNEYDYDSSAIRKIFVDKSLDLVSEDGLKLILATTPNTNVDEHISLMLRFVKRCIQISKVDLAVEYNNKVLGLEAGNNEALWNQILIGLGIDSLEKLENVIGNFYQYDILENILKYSPTPKDYNANLAKILKPAAKVCCIKVFDDTIKYIQNDDKQALDYLYTMGDNLLRRYQFADAIAKYETILGENNKEYRACWNILMAKARATNVDELIRSEKLIVDYPEYEKAINLSGKNPEFYNACIELAKQQKALKEKIEKLYEKGLKNLNGQNFDDAAANFKEITNLKAVEYRAHWYTFMALNRIKDIKGFDKVNQSLAYMTHVNLAKKTGAYDQEFIAEMDKALKKVDSNIEQRLKEEKMTAFSDKLRGFIILIFLNAIFAAILIGYNYLLKEKHFFISKILEITNIDKMADESDDPIFNAIFKGLSVVILAIVTGLIFRFKGEKILKLLPASLIAIGAKVWLLDDPSLYMRPVALICLLILSIAAVYGLLYCSYRCRTRFKRVIFYIIFISVIFQMFDSNILSMQKWSFGSFVSIITFLLAWGGLFYCIFGLCYDGDFLTDEAWVKLVLLAFIIFLIIQVAVLHCYVSGAWPWKHGWFFATLAIGAVLFVDGACVVGAMDKL